MFQGRVTRYKCHTSIVADYLSVKQKTVAENRIRRTFFVELSNGTIDRLLGLIRFNDLFSQARDQNFIFCCETVENLVSCLAFQ